MVAQPSPDALQYLRRRWDLANESGVMLPIPDAIRIQFAERAYPVYLSARPDDRYLASIVDDNIVRWQLAEARRELEDAAFFMRAQARAWRFGLILVLVLLLLATLGGHCCKLIADRLSPPLVEYITEDGETVDLGVKAARACPELGSLIELDSEKWCYFGRHVRVKMR